MAGYQPGQPNPPDEWVAERRAQARARRQATSPAGSDTAGPPPPDRDTGGGQPGQADEPGGTGARPRGGRTVIIGGGGGPVDDGAGVVLAVLVWCWIVLPYLKGGTAGVRNTLRAKFTNKAPDGSELP